jgi:hypothetical protein
MLASTHILTIDNLLVTNFVEGGVVRRLLPLQLFLELVQSKGLCRSTCVIAVRYKILAQRP